MGGAASGTFAFLAGDDGQVFRPRFEVPAELPDDGSMAAARANGQDARSVVLGGVPFRVLSERVSEALVSPTLGRVPISVVQVVEDRSAEQGALDLLLEVLVIGGLAALGASRLRGLLCQTRVVPSVNHSRPGGPALRPTTRLRC